MNPALEFFCFAGLKYLSSRNTRILSQIFRDRCFPLDSLTHAASAVEFSFSAFARFDPETQTVEGGYSSHFRTVRAKSDSIR